jgi:hypothetical protein
MENTEANVLKEMATLEYNLLIKDELLELVELKEFEMAFEVAHNHCTMFTDSFEEYAVTKPFKIINAINKEEEARKQEHNRQFLIQLGIKPI